MFGTSSSWNQSAMAQISNLYLIKQHCLSWRRKNIIDMNISHSRLLPLESKQTDVVRKLCGSCLDSTSMDSHWITFHGVSDIAFRAFTLQKDQQTLRRDRQTLHQIYWPSANGSKFWVRTLTWWLFILMILAEYAEFSF